jgi:hypothetical protein
LVGERGLEIRNPWILDHDLIDASIPAMWLRTERGGTVTQKLRPPAVNQKEWV